MNQKNHTRFCVSIKPHESITLKDGSVIQNTSDYTVARIAIILIKNETNAQPGAKANETKSDAK